MAVLDSKARSRRNPTLPSPTQADLTTVLDQFTDAIAVAEAACCALEAGEDYTTETVALRVGIKMLHSAYDALDGAIIHAPVQS